MQRMKIDPLNPLKTLWLRPSQGGRGLGDWADIRRLHRGEHMLIKVTARPMGISVGPTMARADDGYGDITPQANPPQMDL